MTFDDNFLDSGVVTSERGASRTSIQKNGLPRVGRFQALTIKQARLQIAKSVWVVIPEMVFHVERCPYLSELDRLHEEFISERSQSFKKVDAFRVKG